MTLEGRHDTSPAMTGDEGARGSPHQTPIPLPKAERTIKKTPLQLYPKTGRTLEEELRQAEPVSTPVTFNTDDVDLESDIDHSDDDSEPEEAINAVWPTYGITDVNTQKRMTQRILRLVNGAYRDRPTPTMREYLFVLTEAAKGMGQRY